MDGLIALIKMLWEAELRNFSDNLLLCFMVSQCPCYSAKIQARIAQRLERLTIREENRGGVKKEVNFNIYAKTFIRAVCLPMNMGFVWNRYAFRKKMDIEGSFVTDILVHCCQFTSPFATTQEWLHFMRAKKMYVKNLRRKFGEKKPKSMDKTAINDLSRQLNQDIDQNKSPYQVQSSNPYQVPPTNLNEVQPLNPYQVHPMNPNQVHPMNPYEVQTINPYQVPSMNPYQIQLMNPYQVHPMNSYQFQPTNPYEAQPMKPYQVHPMNP